VTELERAGVLLPDAIERTKALAAALRDVPPKHRSQTGFLATPMTQAMMPRGALGRDRFVEIARLRRLLDAFAGVHGGALDELDVETTGDTGKLVEPGKTQVCVGTWNATGLVAIVFDVRRPKTKKGKAAVDSAPTDVLDQLPAALADLAASAKPLCPGIPVDAVWAIGNDASRASPLGIRRLECFTWPGDAVVGVCCVMSPKLGELVLRVERATREATYTMTEEDASVVLANRPSPHPANVTAAVRALERAGVLWPGIIERVQRVHDEAIAERKLAEEPLQDALLRAALAGDLQAVRAALEAGAAIDCVTYDGMFEWNILGATPLWLAIRKGHFEIAEHLLRSGADVNRGSKDGCHGSGKCTPLRVAAAFGHPGLVRRLLERGADPLFEDWGWGVLTAVATGQHWLGRTGRTGTPTEYAAVIRLLLDAGAPLPNAADCDRLRQMVETGGAPDLASRLVPPPKRD
jgi:hypothetical protein